MARKLFIVARDREALYRSLCSALSNEPEAEVFFDRRKPGKTRPPAPDRRERADVDERIRRDGFAVVRPDPPDDEKEGNIRWSA
jgi:hypothetical protein